MPTDGIALRMIGRGAPALGLGLLVILVSAFLDSCIGVAVLVLPELPLPASDPADWLGSLFLSFFVVLTLGTALGLVFIGLPADLCLHRLGTSSPVAYAACGVAGGLLAALLSLSATPIPGKTALILIAGGLITSIAYWFVFPRRRPRFAPGAGG